MNSCTYSAQLDQKTKLPIAKSGPFTPSKLSRGSLVQKKEEKTALTGKPKEIFDRAFKVIEQCKEQRQDLERKYPDLKTTIKECFDKSLDESTFNDEGFAEEISSAAEKAKMSLKNFKEILKKDFETLAQLAEELTPLEDQGDLTKIF